MRRLNKTQLAAVTMAVNSIMGGQDAPMPKSSDGAPHGVICAANAAKFDENHLSRPLTAYGVGWSDPANLDAALAFFAPDVQVDRKFEFKKQTNSDEFLSDDGDDTVRAIGDQFGFIEFSGTTQIAKTHNRGLTIRVDSDYVKGNDLWRQQYTGRIIRRLKRNELRNALTLLVAAAINTNKTWDTTALKDPDMDVTQACIDYNDLAGIYPNRVGFNQIAWQKRMLSHRAQSVAGGFSSSALINTVDVAQLYGVDQVYVSKERYASTSALRTKIMSDLVLVFYAEANAMPEDASNIKRFWTPCDGGEKLRVYEQQITSKLTDLTVELYSNIIVTSTLGIQKLTIS